MYNELISSSNNTINNSSLSDSSSDGGGDEKRTPIFIGISIISLVIYAVLSSICIYSFFKSIYKKESATLSKIFHVFCFLYTTTRIIWYLKRVVDGESAITFFFNNISFPFYMSALLVVFFFWWERYHSTYVSSSEFLPKYKMYFILFNIMIYIIQYLLILFFYTIANQKREGGVTYLFNTLFQSCLSLLVGLSFLFIVLRIYFKFTSIDKDVCRNQINQVRKICFLTVGISCCFIVRSIIFFYNPITHEYMNYEVFITFGYFLPDIIPIILNYIIIYNNMKTEQEDSSFINMLYENEIEDDETNEGIIKNNNNNNSNYVNSVHGNDDLLTSYSSTISNTTNTVVGYYNSTTHTFGGDGAILSTSTSILQQPQQQQQQRNQPDEASYLLK
ncbi:hypothetical protein DDB_G0290915 [Dictyostelium discoideum AX4]|uniref:THH1/TOM1/TOM3 domain-containing protein n=1 Tax=Dictyostelium discoideum TaxID=44689 RepID=Q54FE5_DICDI|nr:hypothetical protein DDB_G0290915 [Dictyostelium discoideum AX4]EAL61973.1 hypothetical protein DDB_G0290915 [Dictyostelium discoideum AX4]|eukprot:XP_635477.1 hypothetical protein DDB_G0290915 [Dictyostelium discoideum AX4]